LQVIAAVSPTIPMGEESPVTPTPNGSSVLLVGGTELRLADRRPVWAALSNLFLDTDIGLLREATAKELAASPYSVADLERILIDEVYPVCRSNRFAWPGGEWLAFDDGWLEERFLRRLRSPFRGLHWFNLGRLTVRASWEWRRIKRLVAKMRTSDASGESEGAG
jgi:hypothetical protein